MAKNSDTASVASEENVEETKAPASAKAAPPKFPVSDLFARCEEMGLSRPMAAGAVRHFNLAQTDTLTTDEFKQKVDAFGEVKAY